MGDHRRNPLAFGTQVRNPPRIRDTFGRVLAPGDEVLFAKVTAAQFLVADVVPEMAPGVPPNMVRVVLRATVVFHAPADSAVAGLMRIRTAAEQGLRPTGTDATENGSGGADPSADPNAPPIDHEPTN